MPQVNTTTDWNEKTPGWEPMGVDLPDDFINGETTFVLTTIAMLCMQPTPKLVEPHPQCIATLAIYAAGCAVVLDKQQFRKLERTLVMYLEYVAKEDRFADTNNWAYVNYVREKAVERAKRDELI